MDAKYITKASGEPIHSWLTIYTINLGARPRKREKGGEETVPSSSFLARPQVLLTHQNHSFPSLSNVCHSGKRLICV